MENGVYIILKVSILCGAVALAGFQYGYYRALSRELLDDQKRKERGRKG